MAIVVLAAASMFVYVLLTGLDWKLDWDSTSELIALAQSSPEACIGLGTLAAVINRVDQTRALLFAWVFLGEVPPLLVLPGGVLCLAGVALARTSGRAR